MLVQVRAARASHLATHPRPKLAAMPRLLMVAREVVLVLALALGLVAMVTLARAAMRRARVTARELELGARSVVALTM